jgi:lipid A 3-O-deacylase
MSCSYLVSTLVSVVLVAAATDVALAVEDPYADRYTTLARFDNDIFFGSDRGYSNGASFAYVSPTVARFDDERLSSFDRRLNRWLSALQPTGYEYNTMVVSVSHQIFTPEDYERADLIEEDRPYAGVLLFGVSYSSRDGDSMRSSLLQAGIVGPAAGGEGIQDFVHGLTGSEKFSGWDNQLHNEPIVRVMQQWHQRWSSARVFDSSLAGDVIAHGGGSLGNLATFANAGFEVRVGPVLPDDFGSAPILPAGETVSPLLRSNYTERLAMHVFVAVDVRYVVRDITLDGNTWKDSHSVEREPLVADVGIGVAARWRGWKIAIARYLRTSEFDGQKADPELGSITIKREW